MGFFHKLNRFPQGTRLSLFARLSFSRPELWRHVGSVVRTTAGFQVDWMRGAESVAPAWSGATGGGGPRDAGLGTLEFGIALPGQLPETIAVGVLTAEMVRQSRRSEARTQGEHFAGDLGGPRPYRSSWPAPHQLAGHGRRR